MNLRRWVDIDESAISQAIVEYMADTYPGTWNPWAKGSEPWNERDKPP
jgi:hypothetical protein